MSSAHPNFGGSPQHDSEAAGAPPDHDDSGRDLLDAVLQETEKLLRQDSWDGNSASSVELEDMAALKTIVRRRRSETAEFVSIVKEMTAAVLEKTFRLRVGSAEAWEAMTSRIAQTLYDDPAARDRLRALWDRLSEIES